MSQNIYDDEVFFESYKKVRDSAASFNNLLEQPAIKQLLPDIKGKNVLDIGCGFGENCRAFEDGGAARVKGMDISAKMISCARERSPNSNIEYICGDADSFPLDNNTFDLVYSSLAFHYVRDFEGLILRIYRSLRAGGTLIFSQEHPIITSSKENDDMRWHKNSLGGESISVSDYARPGERTFFWFVDGVKNYHRTFSQIINILTAAGFIIEQIAEPAPDEKAITLLPALKKVLECPYFLIVRARKK